MVIYTSEETSESQVDSSVQNTLEGGCQATSESGTIFQFSENCAGKAMYSDLKTETTQSNTTRSLLSRVTAKTKYCSNKVSCQFPA